MIGAFIKRERMNQNISQESLCEGICVASYLSKIENNQLEGSIEVVEQLFKVLDIEYIHDKDRVSKFDNMFDLWYQTCLIEHNYDMLKVNQDRWYKQAKEMSISIRVIEALQLQWWLCEKEKKEQTFQELMYFTFDMNEKQRFLTRFIEAKQMILKGNVREAEAIYFERMGEDQDGIVKSALSKLYFDEGQYHKAIVMGKKAYQEVANQGNLNSMVFLTSLIGGAYCNIDDNDNFMHYNHLCLKLNRFLKNDEVNMVVYYNIGATYMVEGKYEQACEHLMKAYNLTKEIEDINTKSYNLIIQKIVFTFIYLKDNEKAKYYYQKFVLEDNVVNDVVMELLQIMMNHREYIKEKQYIEKLKECFELVRIHCSQGFVLLYGEMLIATYKENRQYKQALELRELLNISK